MYVVTYLCIHVRVYTCDYTQTVTHKHPITHTIPDNSYQLTLLHTHIIHAQTHTPTHTHTHTSVPAMAPAQAAVPVPHVHAPTMPPQGNMFAYHASNIFTYHV